MKLVYAVLLGLLLASMVSADEISCPAGQVLDEQERSCIPRISSIVGSIGSWFSGGDSAYLATWAPGASCVKEGKPCPTTFQCCGVKDYSSGACVCKDTPDGNTQNTPTRIAPKACIRDGQPAYKTGLSPSCCSGQSIACSGYSTSICGRVCPSGSYEIESGFTCGVDNSVHPYGDPKLLCPSEGSRTCDGAPRGTLKCSGTIMLRCNGNSGIYEYSDDCFPDACIIDDDPETPICTPLTFVERGLCTRDSDCKIPGTDLPPGKVLFWQGQPAPYCDGDKVVGYDIVPRCIHPDSSVPNGKCVGSYEKHTKDCNQLGLKCVSLNGAYCGIYLLDKSITPTKPSIVISRDNTCEGKPQNSWKCIGGKVYNCMDGAWVLDSDKNKACGTTDKPTLAEQTVSGLQVRGQAALSWGEWLRSLFG